MQYICDTTNEVNSTEAMTTRVQFLCRMVLHNTVEDHLVLVHIDCEMDLCLFLFERSLKVELAIFSYFHWTKSGPFSVESF